MHFNSRPSARGDGKAIPRRLFRQYFNSRPSARGDHLLAVQHANQAISIHAPPRGATTVLLTPSCFAISFQFTPLREGRPCAGKCFAPAGAFQFTPLREGRLQNGRRRTGQSDFNSRPSARGDSTGSASDVQTYTFQFTPLREGRHRQAGYPTACRRFQFTPLREGRRACRFLVFCGFPFQFTPLREGRPAHSAAVRCFSAAFQFTPLREGRLRGTLRRAECRCISIHAPPRGATILPPRVILTGIISIHAPPRGATKARFLPSAC